MKGQIYQWDPDFAPNSPPPPPHLLPPPSYDLPTPSRKSTKSASRRSSTNSLGPSSLPRS